jgi:hypothetical protein
MHKTLAIPIAVAVAVAALVCANASSATGAAARTYRLAAKMDAGQVVTPKNRPWKAPASVAQAKGTFEGTLNDKTRKLTWRISYVGVGRGPAYAEVHLGKPGRFGLIIVRLCRECRSGQSGVTTVRRQFVDDILSANSWVTVITTKYPNGVIRGQIKVR